MRGKTISIAMALGLALASPAVMTLGAAPAAAQEWREHGGNGGWHHDHDYDHGGIGAGGVILGLAAVAGVAAIASSAAHHDGYYDGGYYAPPQSYYGYAPGYDRRGYSQVAINGCAGAAVDQARGFGSYARFGHIDRVEQRGDDIWVRGTVAIGGGEYGEEDELVSTRFTCKFDEGRVRSLRVDRPAYGYGTGY